MTLWFHSPELFYNLGRLAGLIGFVCLSFLIFSDDTARFFDRYFGLDKIIKFQRKFSLFTTFFVILHPVFFALSDSSFIRYLIIPDLATFPLLIGIISFYIFIVVMIASKIYKRISYAAWQYIHFFTYVLFFFSLYHVVNWGSSSNFILNKTIYGILLVLTVIGIIYRTQYKIRKRFAGKFYVKEIKKEINNVFTLVVEPEKKLHFKAGQFCFLRLNKDNLHARHPFTISSDPHEQDLRFTIKNTGRFTKALLELKNGDEIIIDGPFGTFTLKDNGKSIVLIAGGIGIAPFLSMIRDNLFNEKDKNIFLLYGAKTRTEIISREELDSIQEKWFRKIYVLSEENVSQKGYENGYIDKSLIEKYIDDINNSLFYICGPTKMEEYIKKQLLDLGVKKRNIKIEDFFW